MIHSKIALIISGDVVVGVVLDAVGWLWASEIPHANGTRDRACYKCPARGRVEYTSMLF